MFGKFGKGKHVGEISSWSLLAAENDEIDRLSREFTWSSLSSITADFVRGRYAETAYWVYFATNSNGGRRFVGIELAACRGRHTLKGYNGYNFD